MAYRGRERVPPILAMNAVRVVTPDAPLPVACMPYDRDALHAFLDRDEQDVFALRHDENDIAVVPLTPNARLPSGRLDFSAADNLRLVAALAREAVFRLLLRNADRGYTVTRRRPLTVVAVKPENVIPERIGLPAWLRKRLVLEFDTRILSPTGGKPHVVITCSDRLRTFIDKDCGSLAELGVPLTGAFVTSFVDDPDPRVRGRLRYAGQVAALGDGVLVLDDHGEGPSEAPSDRLYLEPTGTNFRRVVEALTQGKADQILEEVREAEASWHEGGSMLETIGNALGWLSRQDMQLADGVPLRLDGMLDQAGLGPFPRSVAMWKPKLSFDPSGASETSVSWAQRGLDELGPYDRRFVGGRRLRIAVVCEACCKDQMRGAVDDLLRGLPHVRGVGPNSLAPHPNGLVGRFRLGEPDVMFFEAEDAGASSYIQAARRAIGAASSQDETWDLALVQVRREWQERPYEDSPYWATKAAFLKWDTPVQALSIELGTLDDVPYGMAMANMSLAIYAKLGGVPWLLPSRCSLQHELVVGLGSHTVKEGRRGAGERSVGIATVFSGQGHYYLDSRTTAVPFHDYPAAVKAVIVDAVGRVRDDENWQPDDSVRLVFHAFVQVRQDTVEAVVAAVGELGLKRVSFAFLHVVEDHAFIAFDRSAPKGKGAYAPERGLAIELGEREWLLMLTGREQVKGERHGLPDPVLLRLHGSSTHRDMETLTRQVSDFAMHSWRTFGPARLPITLGYAAEIARQLAGLERTPNWDPDAVVGSRVMRRPWFL